jgi:hypothetical protein
MPNLYLSLLHYPVVNKQGETIASAVTNLDLHDIARLSATYGVKAFYAVTPLKDQKMLVEKIVSHWTSGGGSRYNPSRQQAFESIRIKDSLEDVLNDIRLRDGQIPKTIVTCARRQDNSIGYGQLRCELKEESPFLLLFGTAWGLSPAVMSQADYILDPISGNTDYNHLSVRSAASIILDRLIGEYQ